MVTFKCEADNCSNNGVEYNFLGNPETAMCGGCKETLTATDLRDDPETTVVDQIEAPAPKVAK